MTTVLQAYRFALDPMPGQEAKLRSHCGGQRYAFNWGLARIRANVGQRDAERSYGIPDEHLTPSMNWSAYSMRKVWKQAKNVEAPWWPENSKEAYASGLGNLATGLTTGAFGLAERDRRHVTLPRIGTVRTHESTRKLARRVERGTARLRSATVSYRQGRWFCSFSVEVTRADPQPIRPKSVVGVDLGVKSLAVLSTGEVIANPRHLDLALRELRRLQRQAARREPDSHTKAKPSRRWRATQARIAKLHTAVANARRDGLHNLSTRLVRSHGAIVIEDLNVAGMIKNRRLARHIAGVGMGELRRQLTYKTAWSGVHLHVADRWYRSSKTCSDCGAVKTKLPLRVRVFHCERCDLTLDRDLNAARNLAALVEASSPSCGATINEPDGNPHQTHTAWATGTATGRPAPASAGQRQRSNPQAQDTLERFLNGIASTTTNPVPSGIVLRRLRP